MITDEQYAEWLEDDSKDRTVLVEATYANGVKYFSNYAFISGPTDTPANTPYEDRLIVKPIISTGFGGISLGSMELVNFGDLDSWLEESFYGFQLVVYLGEIGWSRDDFRAVIIGVNDGISAPRWDRIRFQFRDKGQRFDVPVQKDRTATGDLIPLSLGTIFNATPILQDFATLLYRVHPDGAAKITAVRDNGVGVSFVDNADGTFSLVAASTGQITCDITGATTGTPAAMVEYLALRAPNISSSDIDADNLANFPATYGLGFYIDSLMDISAALELVMESVSGSYLFTRLGLLQMHRWEPPGTSTLTLGRDDMRQRELSIKEIDQPRQSLELYYAKNWTVQDPGSLAGAVTPANRDLYSKEWQVETVIQVLPPEYPLLEQGDPGSTLIVSQADASTEAIHRMGLFSQKRQTLEWKGFSATFQVALGQTVTLTSERYGFDAGLDVLVIAIRKNLGTNQVTLEVWK